MNGQEGQGIMVRSLNFKLTYMEKVLFGWVLGMVALVVILIGVVLYSGYRYSHVSEQVREDRYLSAVHEQFPRTKYISDNQLISYAKTGCQGFDDGESFASVVVSMVKANEDISLIPDEVGGILTIGTKNWCPKYMKLIPNA